MTWRHGSIGICAGLLFVALSGVSGAANARPGQDEPCDRSTQHSFRAQRIAMPLPRDKQTLKIHVGVEKSKTPWQTFASAMIGTMPPSIVDVTASLGEVLLVVNGLGADDVVTGVDVAVTHKNGDVDLTLDSVDVRDAILPPPPPPERPFRSSAFNVTPTVAITASVD